MNTDRLKFIHPYSLICLLMTAAPVVTAAFADSTPPPNAAIPSVEQNSEIAPEDELTISVINFPNMVTVTYVPRDGQITLPLIGNVTVIGQSTTQLSHSLTPLYSKYLREPIVSVAMTIKHPEFVSVGGAIAHPGTVAYSPGIRLVGAVIQAGGPLQTADLSQVSIVHIDGSQQATNISSLARAAGTASDLPLQEGDAIYIPESTREVSVVGQVKEPSSYPYHDGMTVLDAIGLAGGTTETADLKAAQVSDGMTTTPIDLQRLLQQGDTTANVVLHPGDTITVPLVSRTYIFGDVNRPGYYPFQPGDRIVDALNGAGGTTGNADTSKVYLIRVSANKTAAQSTLVDLNNFFKKGDLASNLTLQPGDVVFVGDKARKEDQLPGISSVLTALGFLVHW